MFITPKDEKEQPTAVTAPGLHIISDFTCEDLSLLSDGAAFRNFADHLINTYELQKLGEIYHDFSGGGFTGVVCLSESHLSIHTWPERKYITFDIFLSNFLHDNREKTQSIYQDVKSFFNAVILNENFISR